MSDLLLYQETRFTSYPNSQKYENASHHWSQIVSQ